MKKWLLGLSCAMALGSAVSAGELHFGEPVDKSAKVEIATILESPQSYVDKTVTVSGEVIGVCKKRGCWMELATDSKYENLRIKVKDGVMVFPVSAKGRQALATGQLKEVKLDLKHTRGRLQQLAEHKGEAFDPSAVTEGMSIYQVVPVGVTILDKQS